MDLLIRGARVVDPSQGLDGVHDIAIGDGRILSVAPSIDAGSKPVVDAAGLCAFPGLVDTHVHLREPGYEYKETIATGTRAAAAGGFTSVACMPNTNPVNDDEAVTRYILEQARAAGVCRVFPVGAISRGQKGEELADMGELREAGCVAVTDDGKPVSSALLMRRALEYAKGFGLTVISHCEDLDLAAGGAMNEGVTSSFLGLPAIPAEAEEAMAARDILLARRTGARLHLAHLSTRGSFALLRWAKRLGLPVTGETAPHYFTLDDSKVRSFDAVYKMNPPLREPEDVAAAAKAVARGTVDAIATDHAPHARDEKDLEFEAAANGVVGLETSLALSLRLVHEGLASLPRVVAALTCGPARVLGLSVGTLRPGALADLVLVDLDGEWEVEPDRFQSKGRNCPFAGMTLKGKVVRTLAGGRTVYKDGRIAAQNLETAEIL